MVSKHGHCLNDLLFPLAFGLAAHRHPAIVSNHPDYAELAASYGIPFHHLPLPTGSSAEVKRAQEQQVEALVSEEGIDLVVLARYMQILSAEFCGFLKGGPSTSITASCRASRVPSLTIRRMTGA